MRTRITLAILSSALTATVASPQVPAGGEFQVNAFTSPVWVNGSVASAANGNFVVVWTGYFPEIPVTAAHGGEVRVPTDYGTSARLYDASGATITYFPLRPGFSFNHGRPSVAFGPAAGFVIAWADSDGNMGRDVFARRFDAAGQPSGAEFRVNTYTTGKQQGPSVCSDAAGNFVVAWRAGDWGGVFAQRYEASGAPRGAEFQVNTYPTGWWGYPVVAGDAGGNFIVAWPNLGQDGSSVGIFAQRYDSFGMPRGSEFQVNSYTTGSQADPAVASDPAGNFVVAWTSEGQDGSGEGVFARRFASSGAPVGGEFRVNTSTVSSQRGPSAAFDAAGAFVIAWTGGSTFVQRYNSSGTRRGSEFLVIPLSGGSQLASDVVGNIVAIAHRGYHIDESAIIGQRLGGIVPAAAAADTVASDSDGNRVLEPGESVDVKPSWRNVNGAVQTFNGTSLSFTGPPAGGVSYQLLDAAATYGTVANGATQQCSDCYGVAVNWNGTRPSLHWDATFTERLTPDALGQTKPWSLHVGQSFADVPKTSPFYRDIETLLHKGVTAGCAADTYCPASPVTRDQMAAFVLLAKEGAGYRPPACSPPNMFYDVPETSIFCDVIEELARRGVVNGCGGGNYCPGNAVSREQMPVFVLRLLDPALDPPACTTPMFADVPASNPFCRWIEELARRGVVAGCGGGNYCPTGAVTRDQMAAFLTGTYGLALYGP